MSMVAAALAGLVAALLLAGRVLAPDRLLLSGVVASVLMLGWLVVHGWRPAPDTVERLLLAFVGWGSVSLLMVRADPLEGKTRLAVWLAGVLILAVARRTPRVEASVVILAVAGLLLSFGIALEFLGYGVPRVGGLVLNPNLAAAWLVPLLPLVRVLPVATWLRVSTAAVLTAGVVLTGSRAGLLALVVVGLLSAPPRVRRLWPLAAVAVSAVIGWRLVEHGGAFAWKRPQLWLASARVFVAEPFTGASPGGFDEAAAAVQPPAQVGVARWGKTLGSAESTPLQLLAETGLPGGLLLAWVAVAGWRLRRSIRFPSACAGSAAAMAVLLVVHDVSGLPVVVWMWALLVGLCLPVADQASAAGSVGGRTVVGVGAAVLVVWGLVLPSLGRRTLQTGVVEGSGGLAAAERATRIEPWLESAYAVPVEYWNRRPVEGLADAAQAVGHAQRAVVVHRRSAGAWRRLGEVLTRCYLEVNATPSVAERARGAFARASELDPTDPWTRVAWARLERAAGRLDRAAAVARSATIVEPACVRAWLLLARIELDRGLVTEARHALSEARAARSQAQGRLLSRLERALLAAPEWQFRQLEEALP